MKKLLLATTAIAGVGLMAGEALAQAPAITGTGGPLRLGIGGYFQAYMVGGYQSDHGQFPGATIPVGGSGGAFTNPGAGASPIANFSAGNTASPGAHRRNFDLKREAEVWFTGETKFDNGLIVGVQVELEASTCSDQIDESYLWFAGSWGRVLLGSTNGAAYKLAVGAPAIDANFDGQDPNYRIFNTGAGFGDPRLAGSSNGNQLDKYVPDIASDSEKITYLSPRIFGFRGGVSWTPDNTEEASSGQAGAKGGTFAGMPANNCNPTNANISIGGLGATGGAATAAGIPCVFPVWGDVISAGLNYEGNLGPVFLQAFVGGDYGFLESVPFSALKGIYGDEWQYQAGVDVGVAGFHLGGGYYYGNNGSGGTSGQRSYSAGLTYTMGPLTVGGTYFYSQHNRATYVVAPAITGAGAVSAVMVPVHSEALQRIVVGARYDLAPGVDIRASVQSYELRADQTGAAGGTTGSNANNNHALFGVIGTIVRF